MCMVSAHLVSSVPSPHSSLPLNHYLPSTPQEFHYWATKGLLKLPPKKVVKKKNPQGISYSLIIVSKGPKWHTTWIIQNVHTKSSVQALLLRWAPFKEPLNTPMSKLQVSIQHIFGNLNLFAMGLTCKDRRAWMCLCWYLIQLKNQWSY